MNAFNQNSKAVRVTVCSVLIIAALVLLEKWMSPALQALGDTPRALAAFTVMGAKIIVPLLLLKTVCGLGPGSLGWVRGGLSQAVWKGVVLAAGSLAFIFLYQRYSPLFFPSYSFSGRSLLTRDTAPVAAGILMSASLLNAFGEEIIFRGMLLPVLSRRMTLVLALLLHSFIFTVYHLFPLQNSVLLFCMGILFGLGYLWSNSLLTPVLAHFIENATGVVLFLLNAG